MTGQPPSPELEEALVELQQYLSDAVAPLIVADSVQLLMKYPPEVVANAIRAWTGAQYRRGAGAAVPISDYLFHTLKKIHMMAEFRLVPREPLEAYLAGLRPLILQLCPAEDRPMLLENLGRLGEAPASISQAQTIFRQAPTEGGGPRASASGAGEAAGVSAGAPAEALHRFSLLLERLEAQGGFKVPVGATVAGPAAAPGASEALAFAARSSQSGRELEAYLARLKEMGLEAGTDSVFRALSQTLPGWAMPAVPGEAGAPPIPESGALGAMRRIITDSESPVETGKRFQEMVRAGIDRFNEGSLPQAVSMFELAERLTSEKKVDAGTVELVRRRLGDTLDGEQLRKFSEKPDQHALLRKLLQFFTTYRPDGLLAEVRREQKRDRRRLILALLEVHGAPARAAAFEELSRVPSTAVGEEEWYFRRNLVYLLRRIPKSAGASFEDESEAVLRHAQLGLPLLLVKESVAALALYKDERAEQGLTQMLFELEAMLLGKPEEAPYEAKDLRALLDRVAATLGKLPAPRARRALIEHAGKKQPQLGDTMARIAELGGQDMSEDTETVDQLLVLLKANLPFKLLGMTLRQNDQNLVRLIEALSGTPSPARAPRPGGGRLALRRPGRGPRRAEGACRFRPAEAGGRARQGGSGRGDSGREPPGRPRGLRPSRAPAEPGRVLGVGLPDAQRPEGRRRVRIADAARAASSPRSSAGTSRARTPSTSSSSARCRASSPSSRATRPRSRARTPREILPLTLEAMRRYDEFQEAAVLVPDAVLPRSRRTSRRRPFRRRRTAASCRPSGSARARAPHRSTARRSSRATPTASAACWSIGSSRAP